MPRIVAGLLTAVGTAMAALVAFTHGDLTVLTIAIAAVSTGLAAVGSSAIKKKTTLFVTKTIYGSLESLS